MVALAEALRKAELHKNNLDLELKLLEEAAEMVIEEEQAEQTNNREQEWGEVEMKECEEEDEFSSSEEEEDIDSSVPKSEEEEQNGASAGPPVTCPSSQEPEHGERLKEEGMITEDMPQVTIPSSCTAGQGEVEGLRKTNDSQLLVALGGVAITNPASSTALLEHQRRNVRILNTEELDSDDEEEPNK